MNREAIHNWFFGLGENYGANPLIFGAIYVGAIPFFTVPIGWLIKNYRQGRSIVLPALAAMFFFVSAYIYLIFAGENVPWLVYAAVVLLLAGGAYSTYRKVRRKIAEPEKAGAKIV